MGVGRPSSGPGAKGVHHTHLDARRAVVTEAQGHVEIAVCRVLEEEVGQLGNLRARTQL